MHPEVPECHFDRRPHGFGGVSLPPEPPTDPVPQLRIVVGPIQRGQADSSDETVGRRLDDGEAETLPEPALPTGFGDVGAGVCGPVRPGDVKQPSRDVAVAHQRNVLSDPREAGGLQSEPGRLQGEGDAAQQAGSRRGRHADATRRTVFTFGALERECLPPSVLAGGTGHPPSAGAVDWSNESLDLGRVDRSAPNSVDS